jgi:hypothetical protein
MSDVDTKTKRRNKRWPEALKREIVAASMAPGASVSVVARQYDVNANQVFSWRRRYRAAEQATGTRGAVRALASLGSGAGGHLGRFPVGNNPVGGRETAICREGNRSFIFRTTY